MATSSPLRKIRNAVARYRTLSEDLARVRGDVDLLLTRIDQLRGVLDAQAEELQAIRHHSSLGVRRGGLQASSLRVLFLVHNVTAWGSLDELFTLMAESEDFEPVVVSIPHDYDHRRGEQYGEEEVHDFLSRAGIGHIRVRESQLGDVPMLLRALDPAIVVRQSQWDADVDEVFSTAALDWTRLVLVPYEMVNIVRLHQPGDPPVNVAVDLPFHRAAWMVFLANRSALHAARAGSLTGGSQFRAVGHPKVDAVRRTDPVWPLPEQNPQRRRVLWSATHSFMTGWNDFGMFPWTNEAMLAWAREEPETDFVLIRHPHFHDTILRPDSPLSESEYLSWERSWNALQNTEVYGGHYAGVMAGTDVVVTDGLSMMCEPQLLGKAVFFLEREGHAPFNEIGEQLATGVHRCVDVEEVRRAVDAHWRRGHDDLSEAQARNVETLFGEPGAARRILQEIRAQIALERGNHRPGTLDAHD